MIPCSAMRACTSPTCMSTISMICSLDRRSKMMVSSIRFKNSGRNARFSASSTAAFRLAALPPTLCRNPSADPSGSPVPRLLVMMSTVFVKSTVRP